MQSDIIKANRRGVTVQGLVEAYGRSEAARIIEKQTRLTIINKQRAMKSGVPMYKVVPKDPIPGRLIIPYATPLMKVGKHGRMTSRFYAEEIQRMQRYMPGFDKYFDVRRDGYAEKVSD